MKRLGENWPEWAMVGCIAVVFVCIGLIATTPIANGQVTVTGSGIDLTSPILANAGVDCNINSATACKFGNLAFGQSSTTYSNSGQITMVAVTGDTLIQGTSGGVTVTRIYIKTAPKTLSNTSATAQTFVRISSATAHVSASGTVDFGIKVSDGTNDQALSGIIRWSYVNTTAGAGGEVCSAAVVGIVDQTAANGGAASSGTASATAAGVTGTDLCDIQITPTFSLTPTTVSITYSVFNQSAVGVVTPQ